MIIALIGTKAQLIKMAPILLQLDSHQIEYKFVLTGQHQETMDDLIHCFGLKRPDDILVDLGESDTKIKLLKWLYLATKAALSKKYFNKNVDTILVHGDTLSTLFGAIIGKLYSIPVSHIEAGLRSFHLFHPFPEEAIRIMVSKLSTRHYCPGTWAVKNLKANQENIVNTSENTLLDALRIAQSDIAEKKKQVATPYIIVSMHRNENLSSTTRLNFLLDTIVKCSKKIPVKFVLHPATRAKLTKDNLLKRLDQEENITLIDRMNYVEFISLLGESQFLLTDGGSNQEESYYLNIPCLLLRKSTERKEGLSENVTVSNYDPLIIDQFIHKNLCTKRKEKHLPEIYPSRIICEDIQRHFIQKNVTNSS